MSSDSEFVQRADTAVYETEDPVLYGDDEPADRQ